MLGVDSVLGVFYDEQALIAQNEACIEQLDKQIAELQEMQSWYAAKLRVTSYKACTSREFSLILQS